MIVVITSRGDAHVRPVVSHLDAAGMPWVRINTEDAATNVEMVVDPAAGEGLVRVRDSGREFLLEHVNAVWYRKPKSVAVSHFDLDVGAREYVEAEFREIMDGLYTLLGGARWINSPFETRAAYRKMRQLQVAASVGFRTPKTIVTNKPDVALAFADTVGGDIAVKSLGAISVAEDSGPDAIVQYGIFTRRITRLELEAVLDKVGHLPTTFQEFIPKKYELRVTCVGEEVFCCRIQPRADDVTADDYRFDTGSLEHSAVDYPALRPLLRAYMTELGLNFACFDFVVPEDGVPVFLEANPNGQWLWVERLTGLPIASSIGRWLLTASQ